MLAVFGALLNTAASLSVVDFGNRKSITRLRKKASNRDPVVDAMLYSRLQLGSGVSRVPSQNGTQLDVEKL